MEKHKIKSKIKTLRLLKVLVLLMCFNTEKQQNNVNKGSDIKLFMFSKIRKQILISFNKNMLLKFK